MSNSYLPSNNKPTIAIMLPADDDPYSEIAMEGGGLFGKFLKYIKGRWQHDENEIPIGTEFMVLMSEAMRGDVKFQDGRPVEQRIGFIRDRAKFARRSDLGDNDESFWERNKKGERIDPWSPQTYLPMIHIETGELYCFVFRSAGAKQTFRNLCKAYSPYRKTRTLPIVSLQTDKYNHLDYSWIDIPILRIERWELDGFAPATPPDSDGGVNAKVISDGEAESVKPVRRAEMNDEIPF